METSVQLTPSEAQNVGNMKRDSGKHLKLDEIGEWSELKMDILKKYAGAYCTILKARNLHPIYIDGFAGAGTHVRKRTSELVKGSPLNALEIQPPFDELHLIDIDQTKVDALKRQTAGMKHVHVYTGDANQILPEDSAKRHELVAWAMKCGNMDKQRNMIDSVRTLVKTVHKSELNRKPMLFNCNDGTADLKTGQIRPCDRNDLLTKCVPVQWDLKAECGRWEQYLQEVFDGRIASFTTLSTKSGSTPTTSHGFRHRRR